MIRLHSNWAYLEQEFDCSIRDRFLMAVRSLDNPRAVTPFLAEVDGKRFGLFMHVEKGNVEAANLPPDIIPIYYRPYFTFEASEHPPTIKETLADAVDSIAKGEGRIIIDSGAPMSVGSELATHFSLELDDFRECSEVTLRKAPCADTIERLGRRRLEAAQVAHRLLDQSPVRAAIFPYLDQHTDKRFATLDEAGFVGLVVSSALNMQEVAGVPVGSKQRPIAVFYAPGEGHGWILEAGRVSGGHTWPTAQAALQKVIPRGKIGVETEDVSLRLAQELGLNNRDYGPADLVMRQWRDENTLPDLAFYVIAARTTRYAIEGALGFAASALDRKIALTEMDAYSVYLRRMHEFVAENMQGFKVRRTLSNFHAGARTIFPANAAPFPLCPAMNTLKVDAGCLLFDDQGVLLGCSDIARTLALSDASAELYSLFQRTVRRCLIPDLATDKSGDTIHEQGVNAIWKRRESLAGNPLFVDMRAPHHEYARDIGHLLGKNNLSHLRFAPGDNHSLREGMIACCEYQWPLKNNAIAYEDTCVVSAEGGLNITSDEE
jgi:hypothetical protein